MSPSVGAYERQFPIICSRTTVTVRRVVMNYW